MTKEEIINSFVLNHNEISNYVNSLIETDFIFKYKDKWSAGQQLSHVYLTLVPLQKILPLKELLIRKNGTLNREPWSFEILLKKYLNTSRKAPEQFVPSEIKFVDKNKIITDLKSVTKQIQEILNSYNDEEFKSIVIPHPLLGKISIQELFYLMSYHPLHHKNNAIQNLKNK